MQYKLGEEKTKRKEKLNYTQLCIVHQFATTNPKQ